MRLEKRFLHGFVIGISVFICIMAGALANPSASHAAYSILHSFDGGSGGAWPTSSLTLNGSTLYGLTSGGGRNEYGNTYGTIFRIKTDGAGYKVLHSFGSAANDGLNPYPFSSLTLSGSTLYGMTYSGGDNANGTIFQINTDGAGYKVLYSFGDSGAIDGANPNGSLTLSGSTLYGMTTLGGDNGAGTIFQINADGTEYQVLYSFGDNGANDGANPNGSLILCGATLYGMTFNGGDNGAGTIFQINTDGTGYNVLYSFGDDVTNDGANPSGALTLSGITLYGTTANGGANPGISGNGAGTIFQINTDGTGYNVLYNFGSVTDDGASPCGSITLSADGYSLYGMTSLGGNNGAGTIFQISTDGTVYNVLYSFSSFTNDGSDPSGNSLTLSGSTLYGMTFYGGAHDFESKGAGTIFSLLPSIPVAPTNVLAAAGNEQAAVSFTLPSTDGGSLITGYTVTSKPGGITATSSASPIIVPGLNNGTAYAFTVTATNSIGTSPPSASSNRVKPSATPISSGAVGTWNFNGVASGPDAPWWTIFTIIVNPDGTFTMSGEASDGSSYGGLAGVWWVFPNGIAPNVPGVSNGNFLCQIDSDQTVLACTQTWADGTTELDIGTQQAASYSFADLAAGIWEGSYLDSGQASSFWARVQGMVFDSSNGNFTGSYSDSTGLSTTTTGQVAISSAGAITCVSGDCLSSSNYSAIMDASKTVMVATSGASSIAEDAVLYVFTRKAASYSQADLAGKWEGNSLISGIDAPEWTRYSATISPSGTFTLPSANNNGSSSSGTGKFSISSTGLISCVSGGCNSSGADWSAVMDAAKTVWVSTQSTTDGSDKLAIFTKSSPAIPPAPTIGTATAGARSAKVTFTSPASNGGSAITSYIVTSSGGQKASGPATATSITVTGLTNGVSYTFTVAAKNAIGIGPASGPSNSVTPGPLPAAATKQ